MAQNKTDQMGASAMKHIQIAKDKSAKIQELLKQRPKTRERVIYPRYDKIYFEAINAMNQEEK